MKSKATMEEKVEGDAAEENPKGIPEFWLTIFRSVDMLSDMLQVIVHSETWHVEQWVSSRLDLVFWILTYISLIPFQQEHDEPILKHLQDIKVIFSEPKQPMVRQYLWLFCLFVCSDLIGQCRESKFS